ncbi:MAG: biotin synthase BioB [Candidatus Eremiobacteraeota bacterium]|nr:biotin synthase BioB [Candidatus Eremiobacteraeota bacterium]MBV8497731.1 biotin synthase BioB [Candidatus Eremiobacteraeota bacterium]
MTQSHAILDRARTRVLGRGLAADERLLRELAALPEEGIPGLLALADDVRSRHTGNAIAVEVLYNAKKGGCSEDCNFCSQSARYATDIETEPLSSVEGFVAAARDAHARGAGEFCIVVAVRGPSERLLERVCTAVPEIKRELPLTVAVSLGILTDGHVERLAQAGVDKVNHNLETSERYFPSICTTHTYQERWETCLRVKRHALELCCGGIIGMGETLDDRIAFLVALQELQPEEIPVNFLNPRPGTPFGDRPLLDPAEALRFVAMVRLALPSALVRFAGGREVTLKGLQELGMRSGASGIVLGDYLTTPGRGDAEDFGMLDRLGFEVLA